MVNVSDKLRRAIDNAAVAGDYSLIERLVSVIESWDNVDDEERRPYRIFMSRCKSLYKRT
ncbi:hypothetical protein Vdis_1344 [Vulcanisaeta distributa DSM 14429]|uniref:Uncharacterized protein n=1 Tax=Vulcanisaeta distributa (strain DSM 14429 / JCM 11212 / NBRC 100878 / IC-017) TaxID=572478 RepID=E1QS13_VULDI|nr:hypothetical protein Vdis_1344 [Vulcanisaeta distributa DSM 14429]